MKKSSEKKNKDLQLCILIDFQYKNFLNPEMKVVEHLVLEIQLSEQDDAL